MCNLKCKFLASCTLTFLLMLALPQLLQARVLLFPNGERMPGEIGVFMGGAQVALASGTEAAWYNPAGMAKEARTVVSGGGFGMELQDVELDSGAAPAIRPLPGFLSFSTSPSASGAEHRFSYGFFLFWPVQNEFPTRLVDDRSIDQQGLPPTLLGPQDLDALFPDGIARSENAGGFGELSIAVLGFAAGIEIAEWFRAGVSLRWERLRFEERTDAVVAFAAGGTAENPDVLSGFQQTSAVLLGEAQRFVYTLGFQIDQGRSLTWGLTFRFPSQGHRGDGSISLAQSSGLRVTQSNQDLVDTREFLLVREQGVNFALRSPGEIKLGVAWRLDTFTIELDWTRAQRQGGYQVFPAVASGPESTRAVQIAPLRTALNEVDRYAVGVAVSSGESSSFLFGFTRDTSAVPADDPVFRKVDLNTLSGGYYLSRGAFSGSAGVAYRFGEESAVSFPQFDGATAVPGAVSFQSYSLLVGASYIF